MTVRVACVQSDVVFNDPTANANAACDQITELAGQGVQLAVFPEAYLTGYCVSCAEDAEEIAIEVLSDKDRVTQAHESVIKISRACQENAMHAVVGLAGKDGQGVYNGAILFRPSGEMHLYKKTHLPHLGLDRFVHTGDEFMLVETEIGKIGVLICYDMRAPEPTRVLALRGADMVILPTNWPEGAEISADHICIARAAENKIFFVACNRVGEEHGFRFIGGSKIIAPSGKVLAQVADTSQVITADLDIEQARDKRVVNKPGEYELDLFGSRTPHLYGDITLKTNVNQTARA
jgi:predicted amidohydrolase